MMSSGIQPDSLANRGIPSMREPSRQEISAFCGRTVQPSTSCPTLSQAYSTVDAVSVTASFSSEQITPSREQLSAPPPQWLPLPGVHDIHKALRARSTELNYRGLMIKLTEAYKVDFMALSELLPRTKCESSPLAQDPTEYRLLSRESSFYWPYLDNYINFKKETSEFYLLIKILEAERILVNPDIQLPAYSEIPTASHKADQGDSVKNQITAKAKAKAIRTIFFIDLLNHFSAFRRLDFRESFSQFINSEANHSLKNDLLAFFPFIAELWKLREHDCKATAKNFLKDTINSLPSDSEIQESIYRHVFEIIFSKESSKPRKYKYPLYKFNQNWSKLKKDLPQEWNTQPKTDLTNTNQQALKLSLITDAEIPCMTTSPELLELLETARKRLSFPKGSGTALAFNFPGLVQAFSELRRIVPCTIEPIDSYMGKLPEKWQPLRVSYFNQHYFHEMDRHAVFLLARLSEAESKVTGISANPPDYQEALNSPSDHDNPCYPAPGNATKLTIQSWKIMKEFVQSLQRYLMNCRRKDFINKLDSFCKDNGFAGLLPDYKKDATESIDHSNKPINTSVKPSVTVHHQPSRKTESKVPKKEVTSNTSDDRPSITPHKQTSSMTRHYEVPVRRRAPDAPAPSNRRQQKDRAKQNTDSRCIIA